MASDTTLSRIGRFEFFPIVVPGFYLVTSIWILILMYEVRGTESVWAQARDQLSTKTENWMLPLLIIGMAYLLGSLVRAFPVNWADKPLSIIQYWSDSPRGKKKQEDFPYRSVLKRALKGVRSNRHPNQRQRSLWQAYKQSRRRGKEFPLNKTYHTWFNYLKVVTCELAPYSFAFTQALESRVRLFAGMFWAGMISVAILLVGLLTACNSSLYEQRFVWVYIGASLAIALIFQRSVRRARREEVQYVILSYLALDELDSARQR